jgi:hypothetical protein
VKMKDQMMTDVEARQWLPTAFMDTALSDEEKTEIAEEEASRVRVTWLRDNVPQRPLIHPRLALESVLLVAVGVAAGEFLKGALAEAGADAWNGIKSVVSKTFRKQSQRSYQMFIKAYLILDWRDKKVRLLLLQDLVRKGDPLDHLDDQCDKALSEFQGRWNEIEKRLIQTAAKRPTEPQAYQVVVTSEGIFVRSLDMLPEDEENDSDWFQL